MRFYKYQGAGNDFIISDNRDNSVNLSQEQISRLCDRRFGIGADGLMLLESSGKYDFKMRYFNSDGAEGTMCGNGGRCLVAFADRMGITSLHFEAIDGEHVAEIVKKQRDRYLIRLQMQDVKKVEKCEEDMWFLNTGSPHLVIFVSDLKNYPVAEKGAYWRHHKNFPGGTNVNFVEQFPDHISVRTFERGVEDETYACGTGVTASAIASYIRSGKQSKDRVFYPIKAIGGELSVDFIDSGDTNIFKQIYLTGPAEFVFQTQLINESILNI